MIKTTFLHGIFLLGTLGIFSASFFLSGCSVGYQFTPLNGMSEAKFNLAIKARDEAIMTLHKRLEAVEGVKKEAKK